MIRAAAAIILALIVIWLMRALESVTTMLMLSFFLAYVLNPAADWMVAWKIPRPLAALALVGGVIALLLLIIVFVVPSIVEEILAFVSIAPKYFSALKDYLIRILAHYGVALPDTWDQIFAMIWQEAQKWVPSVRSLANPLAGVAKTVFRSTLTLISSLLYLILIPILVYYLLVSFNRIKAQVKELIPPYAREGVLKRLGEMDLALSGFVRGQVIICLILAVLYSLGFAVIGIDLALVVGIVSGLLFIIPYVGTLFGLVVGSLMALAKYGDITHVLYVIGWIALVQTVEGYILTPRIVGQAVGLHPVIYIVALIVGAQLFGFVGMLVAIPTAAILKVLIKAGIELYRESDIYQDRTLEDEQG
ncbi:MAG: AI-2E family transporter [Deltaproteobacteria bacterium]